MILVLVAGVMLVRWLAPHHDDCRFERTWYAGDIHFNEELTFFENGQGLWVSGGFAEEARHERRRFTWTRDASQVTVEAMKGGTRTVRYTIHRDHCMLVFEEHPLLDDNSGFRHFTTLR